MDQTRYTEFLISYTKSAMDNSDGTSTGADHYLSAQKKPGFFAPTEKKAAFHRVRKVFAEMRDRPVWLVLKALGLSTEELT